MQVVSATPSKEALNAILAQLNAGETVAAFSKVKKLQKKHPKNASLKVIAANCLVRSGSFREALRYTEKAINLHGRAVPLLLVQAEAFEKLGAEQKAMSAFKEVLKQEPSHLSNQNPWMQ